MFWFLLFMTIVIGGIGYGIGGVAGGSIAVGICVVSLIIWGIYATLRKPGIDYIKDDNEHH